MNYELFNKIVIGIATIALSFTAIVYLVYFVGIGTIWAWVYKEASPITATATVVLALTSIIAAIIGLSTYYKKNKKNSDEKKDKDKSDRLLVRPSLTRSVDKRIEEDDMRSYEFGIINCGVGPAFIKKFELSFDGKKISCNNYREYKNFLEELFKKYSEVTIGFLYPDSALAPGNVSLMWKFKYSVKDDISFLNKLRLKVEYESIYKDKTYIYDTEKELEFHGGEPSITPSESSVAGIMAGFHALCFTVPRPWNENQFTYLLKDTKIFYITLDHGFILGRWMESKRVELLTLAIFPPEQSRGFGRALLNGFIEKANDEGKRSIFLKVAENNAPALHLFEKAGFKRIGLRPAYYKAPNAPNIDAVLMRLDI